MLAILSAVTAFFNAIRALIGWQDREAEREAGAAEAINEGNKKSDAAITTANQARADMHNTLTRDPSRLRDDDSFRRD